MSSATHDDFYQRLRQRITKWSQRNEIKPEYANYLLALPDLFHLVMKLMLDARVTPADRTLLGIALAYVVSPIDVLPDFLGPAGYLDDLLVCALVLEAVLKRVPQPIVDEHWAGGGDVLRVIRETLEKADTWSKGTLAKVRAYLQRMGVGEKAGAVMSKAKDLGREVKEEVEETLAKKRKARAVKREAKRGAARAKSAKRPGGGAK